MAEPQRRLTAREILELRRRQRPAGATLGGPRQAEQPGPPQLAPKAPAEGGFSLPTLASAGGALAESAASLVGGGLGGAVVRPLARRLATSPFARAAVEYAAGRVPGAGLGGLAGSEALTQFGPPETPEMAFYRRLFAGAAGAGGEALAPAFGLITRPVSRRLRGMRGGEEGAALEPGAAEAQAIVRGQKFPGGESFGATLTPGVLVRGFSRTLEKIGEAAYGAQQLIQRTRRRASAASLQAWRQAAPRMVEKMGTDEVGMVLKAAIEQPALAARTATRAAYGAVDTKITELGGDPNVVNLRPALEKAQALFAESLRRNDPVAVGILNTLAEPEAVLEVMNRLKLGGPTATIEALQAFRPRAPVSFKLAEEIRGDLLAIARAEEGLVPGKAKLAIPVAQAVDEAIQSAGVRAGVLGREVLDAIALARATSKEAHELYDNELIGQLMSKVSPEQMAETLFAADRPSRIRAVWNAIDHPRYREALGRPPEEVKNVIRAKYLETLETKAGASQYATMDGRKLRRAVESGRGTFEALFENPVQRQTLLTAAHALEKSQERVAGRGFQVFVQLTQATAAFQTAQWAVGFDVGPFVEPGAGRTAVNTFILMAPWVATAALLRPRVVDVLVRSAASKERRAGGQAARWLGQFAARLMEEQLPFTILTPEGEQIEMPAGQAGRPAGLKPVSKLEPPQ